MLLSFNRWTVAGSFALFLIVVSVAHLWNDSAVAQAPAAAASEGRYQISAYASPTESGRVHHGCYIVDTATGTVWHTRAGGTAEKISGNLQ
jgi:hypothetical protein